MLCVFSEEEEKPAEKEEVEQKVNVSIFLCRVQLLGKVDIEPSLLLELLFASPKSRLSRGTFLYRVKIGFVDIDLHVSTFVAM